MRRIHVRICTRRYSKCANTDKRGSNTTVLRPILHTNAGVVCKYGHDAPLHKPKCPILHTRTRGTRHLATKNEYHTP